jgi:thioredoxin reductase (NADPH)
LSDKPSILAIDDEPEVLSAVLRDLRARYGTSYRVIGAGGGDEAIETIRQLSLEGAPLALILADQRMPKVTGLDVLRASLQPYPIARRALLTAYADTDVAITAINELGLDHYIMKPWHPPEDLLYPILDDLLDDWHAAYRPGPPGLRVVSNPWSREGHEIKAFLAMNQVPYQGLTAGVDKEADILMEAAGQTVADLPMVVLEDGTTMSRPELREVAERVGLRTTASEPAYDLVVVGGGPAGLASAVYASSEGLRTLLIESSAPGGQAGQSSMIENYLGFPKGITGADLARRASTQAKKFGTEVLVPATVTRVERKDPFRIVHLADGSSVTTKALMIATGVSYRRLQAEGLDDLIGTGVYYGTSRIEAESHRGRPMFIVGAGNSAGQAALFLSRFTDSVTLVIRRPALVTMSKYLVDQLGANPAINVIPTSQLIEARGDTHLESIVLKNLETEEISEHEAGAVFIFIGQKAHTDWISDLVQVDEQGFVLTGSDLGPLKDWNVDRDPLALETSVPGIFAAGDVRHGSVRRVAGATGEGSSAIRFVHQHLARL